MRLTSTVNRLFMPTIHTDFEGSGCISALQRLQQGLRAEFPNEFRRVIVSVPSWITSDFNAAWAAVSIRDAVEYKRRFARMAHYLSTGELAEDSVIPTWMTVFDDDPYGGVLVQGAVSKCRMGYGIMLEAYVRHRAAATVHVASLPSGAKEAAAFARLCSDAYFAALWTDAHVQYAFKLVDNGSMSDITFAKTHSAFGAPSLCLTASISKLPMIAGQLEDFMAGKPHKTSSAKEILGLLSRCTQSGSRGWESALKAALQNDVVKHVCSSAFLACCIGMHPQIHPACRSTWDARLLVRSIVESALAPKPEDVLCQCNVAVKESIRIYMCTMLTDTPASRAAYAASGSSVGLLTSAPVDLAHPALQAATQSLVKAGLKAAKSIGSSRVHDTNRQILVDEVLKCIGMETRCRKRQGASLSSSAVSVDVPATAIGCHRQTHQQHHYQMVVASVGSSDSLPVAYTPSWISRAQSLMPTATPKLRAIDVAKEMMTRCFRMHFVPVWLHSHGNGVRTARLGQCQQQHVHSTSPTHLITRMLDESIVLRLQRVVARDPLAFDTSVADLARLVGVDDATTTRLAACNSLEAAITAVTSFAAKQGAMFIAYCKIASLKEKMLSFNLGPTTKERQLRALRLRFDLHNSDDVERDLPHHAKFLYWCLECGRVPNACVECSSRDVPHNEIGVSQTMLRVGPLGCDSNIRCARRSSAALRTALQKEDDAVKHRIEQIEVCEVKVAKALGDNGDISHAARLRRDVKSCSEQHAHALACGDTPMVKIPLVGNCVRIQSKFYSICCCCGSVMHVDSSMRFGSDLCCNRCDPSMLGGPTTTHNNSGSSSSRGKTVPTAAPRASRVPTDSVFYIAPDYTLPCRFCGKPAPTGSSTKFRVVRSPKDTSGRNSRLPPPLRTVAYCTTHFRQWVENAHRTMDSKVILAHISEKATPVFGADTGRRNGGNSLRLTRARNSSLVSSIEKRMRANRRAQNTTSR